MSIGQLGPQPPRGILHEWLERSAAVLMDDIERRKCEGEERENELLKAGAFLYCAKQLELDGRHGAHFNEICLQAQTMKEALEWILEETSTPGIHKAARKALECIRPTPPMDKIGEPFTPDDRDIDPSIARGAIEGAKP